MADATQTQQGDTGAAERPVKVERRTAFDALGRARWLLLWRHDEHPIGQIWFGTETALREMLDRCGFTAIERVTP